MFFNKDKFQELAPDEARRIPVADLEAIHGKLISPMKIPGRKDIVGLVSYGKIRADGTMGSITVLREWCDENKQAELF